VEMEDAINTLEYVDATADGQKMTVPNQSAPTDVQEETDIAMSGIKHVDAKVFTSEMTVL